MSVIPKISNFFQSRVQRAKIFLDFFMFAYFEQGDKVLCETCGWRGKRFFQGRCPRCYSLPRHRLIPYAVRHFQLSCDNGIYLHVGANKMENGWFLRAFPSSQHVCVDLCRLPWVHLQGDFTKLPLADQSIHGVVSWHVLEHIPEDRKAIREMHRVLKENGFALVSVPIYPADRETTYEDVSVPRDRYLEIFGHHDHVRACGKDYKSRLEEAGFKVTELSVKDIGNFSPSQDQERFGLSESHIVWLCHKQEKPFS